MLSDSGESVFPFLTVFWCMFKCSGSFLSNACFNKMDSALFLDTVVALFLFSMIYCYCDFLPYKLNSACFMKSVLAACFRVIINVFCFFGFIFNLFPQYYQNVLLYLFLLLVFLPTYFFTAMFSTCAA